MWVEDVRGDPNGQDRIGAPPSRYYTEQGWIVHVFLWVVGIRGMIDPAHVESLLKIIGVQQKHRKVAAERSALASVRAFHFLHKVRFGGLSYATRSDLNSDNSDCEQDDNKDGGQEEIQWKPCESSPRQHRLMLLFGFKLLISHSGRNWANSESKKKWEILWAVVRVVQKKSQANQTILLRAHQHH
jgi:hypothetical protein